MGKINTLIVIKVDDFVFNFIFQFFSQRTVNSLRNMNTDQYLDEAFYMNISTSEDRAFNFSDGKFIKYRTAVIGSANVSFQVKTQHFLPFEKQFINPKSSAPYLVKLAVDSDTVTPFNLLKEALQRNLGTTVDCWYENMAYLNTDEKVFSQLQTLINYGEKQLVFTIEVRHIIFHDGQNPRVKYLLQAVDKVPKRKRQSAGKKPKVPKLNMEAAQAIMDTIPKDIPLPDLGDLEAFLTSK